MSKPGCLKDRKFSVGVILRSHKGQAMASARKRRNRPNGGFNLEAFLREREWEREATKFFQHHSVSPAYRLETPFGQPRRYNPLDYK